MPTDDKSEVLEGLRKKIEGLPKTERTKILGGIFTRIISTLTQRLIKYEGYAVTDTILKRELAEIGKHDAHLISDILGIKTKTPEDSSKVLKVAALILGFDLDVEGNETIVRECPFAVLAKENNEPRLCSLCQDYCQGVIDGVLGRGQVLDGVHDFKSTPAKCFYKLKK